MKSYPLTLTRNEEFKTPIWVAEEKSFVWFIDGDKDSSPLTFYDVGYPLIRTDQILTFKFVPGTFVIFPGYLPHEVYPNKSKNRLIVSGNVI